MFHKNDIAAMQDARTEPAAALLRAAKTDRHLIDALPEELAPADIATALAVQQGCVDEPVGGWKCGLPLGERRILAPIFASAILDAPGPIHVRNDTVGVEAELAFVLANNLSPRGAPYDRADVAAAIGAVHLALELVHGRFRDPAAIPFPQMLADRLFNEGIVLGPRIALAAIDTIDTLTVDGVPSAVRHPAGDPLAPLVWLANALSARGDTLHGGATIITGAYLPPMQVAQPGDHSFTFGQLGTLHARFAFERRSS